MMAATTPNDDDDFNETDRPTDEGNQYLVFSSFTWEPLLGEEVFMCEKFFRWFFCSFWRFFLWCCRSFFFLFSYLWIFTWIGMGFKLIFFLKASERYDDTFSKKKKQKEHEKSQAEQRSTENAVNADVL